MRCSVTGRLYGGLNAAPRLLADVALALEHPGHRSRRDPGVLVPLLPMSPTSSRAFLPDDVRGSDADLCRPHHLIRRSGAADVAFNQGDSRGLSACLLCMFMSSMTFDKPGIAREADNLVPNEETPREILDISICARRRLASCKFMPCSQADRLLRGRTGSCLHCASNPVLKPPPAAFLPLHRRSNAIRPKWIGRGSNSACL